MVGMGVMWWARVSCGGPGCHVVDLGWRVSCGGRGCHVVGLGVMWWTWDGGCHVVGQRGGCHVGGPEYHVAGLGGK